MPKMAAQERVVWEESTGGFRVLFARVPCQHSKEVAYCASSAEALPSRVRKVTAQ